VLQRAASVAISDTKRRNARLLAATGLNARWRIIERAVFVQPVPFQLTVNGARGGYLRVGNDQATILRLRFPPRGN
jgi:hypothetical protein